MTQLSEKTKPDREDLVKEMMAENEFILKLVSSIPANMYFDHDMTAKLNSHKHAIMDKKAEALKRSSSNQIILSTKNKHKRARLDPTCHKSVLEVQEELSKKKQRKGKTAKKFSKGDSNRATNVEELRSRLHQRILELQSKRNLTDKGNQSEKKLKKKDKKVKLKKAALSKVNEVDMQTKKHQVTKDSVNETDSAAKPKFNKDGSVIYGKLNFSGEDIKENKQKVEYKGKDYKNMLKKAEKKQEKLESLKEKDPEKAKTVEEKEKWKKAIMRSENAKVKDDPVLLKKSVKRQQKLKDKRAKAWKERDERVEAKLKARQEKRTNNIQKRKQDKLKQKVKRAKKKGRVVIH